MHSVTQAGTLWRGGLPQGTPVEANQYNYIHAVVPKKKVTCLPGQPWRESSALASRTQVATEQSDLQAIGYLLAAA